MSEVAKKPRISLTKQIVIATVVGLVLGTLVGPKIAGIKVIGDIFLRFRSRNGIYYNAHFCFFHFTAIYIIMIIGYIT